MPASKLAITTHAAQRIAEFMISPRQYSSYERLVRVIRATGIKPD